MTSYAQARLAQTTDVLLSEPRVLSAWASITTDFHPGGRLHAFVEGTATTLCGRAVVLDTIIVPATRFTGDHERACAQCLDQRGPHKMTVLTKTDADTLLAAQGATWASPMVDIVDALTPAVAERIEALDDSEGLADIEAAVAEMIEAWA